MTTRCPVSAHDFCKWLGALIAGCAIFAGGDEPDLTWSPEAFRFRPGPVVRYIDFDAGDDAAAGTREAPWQHHPWDANAAGNATAAEGPATYCFKQGVIYRGTLVARHSGEPGRPVQLTVDPSWGRGVAELRGSTRISGGWQRCTDSTGPDIPAAGRSATWYLDLPEGPEPRWLWEEHDGQITSIAPARTPNWRVTNPDDPRGEWWELTGCVILSRIPVENPAGFRVGDLVRGSGKYIDRDENRDNLAEGRNAVAAVGKDHLIVAIHEAKRGEFKKNAYITNGPAATKITAGPTRAGLRVADSRHFPAEAPGSWTGATFWGEGDSMADPKPSTVVGYDEDEHSLRVETRYNSAYRTYCRYYLEGLPHFLDEPGEFCFVKRGGKEPGGRLLLRLPDDRDPNRSIIEIPTRRTLIEIPGQSYVSISGLTMRFLNSPHHQSPDAVYPWRLVTAVRMVGNCSNIEVRNCTISHLPYGVSMLPESAGDVLDRITIADNDMFDLTGAAIVGTNGSRPRFAEKGKARLRHLQILRNRLQNIGLKHLIHYGKGSHAVHVLGAETADVAYNIVDRTYGAGILMFNGSEYDLGNLDRPLIRVLIHHNKVTNSLLAMQDYGGIASWMAGPSYVYCNISGNPVGYKHENYRRLQRKDWYRTSCYGVGIYIDGQYKGYVFNNIMWGKNNNVNDRLYNSCAFNEAMGFLNTVFNNTMYRFGVGLHKGMTQHNRCYYMGNLMLDIGHKFIQQEPRPQIIEHDSLAYSRNVFSGAPPSFGQLGHDVYTTVQDWRKAMAEKGMLVPNAGVIAESAQVADAPAHDFRPRPDSAAVDAGAKVFVPWSLCAVVGEWGFLRHPADPIRILGENVNWNDEWYHRSMYQHIPRNDLIGRGIDAESFTTGTLENWVAGALELNGEDEYCELTHADMTRGYSWELKNMPFWYQGKTTCDYDGAQRVTVDMQANNFLIETVFRTAPGRTSGGLVSKCDQRGYVLDLAPSGAPRMTLHFGDASCSRTGALPVNDGRWHHVIAEVDRAKPQGIRIYIDGKAADGAWSGQLQPGRSLANAASFLVGKTGTGAAGDTERLFAGALDFLRVSRGTLADAETTIEELYKWEFDGPALRDFQGRRANGECRDAGALELVTP